MPAIALTATEIAAAEAAAIAAAEAAAVHAAQVAAAQAAQAAAAQAATQAAATTAANTAAANTATATATNAATNQSVLNAIGASPAAPASAAQLGGYGAGAAGGIPTLGTGAGTGANLGYDALAKEVGTGGLQDLLKQPLTNEALPSLPPEISNLTSGAQRIVDTAPVIEQTAGYGLKNSVTNAIPSAPTYPNSQLPPFDATQYINASMNPGSVAPPAVPPAPTNPLYQFQGPKIGVEAPSGTFSRPDPLFNITPSTTQGVNPIGTSLESSVKPPTYDPFYNVNSGAVNSMGYQRPLYDLTSTGVDATAVTPGAPETGGLKGLYNDFINMPLKDKLLTGMAGTVAYDMLNKPDPYEKPKYKSTFKPGLYTGYQPVQPTPYRPQYAVGGLADLGGYSDGGRMLKGPGDGMSDDIPATIANKQPARLANEEFVIPADVVSHLGNGSSEAGAKVLYKMMDRVRQARTGNKKQGKQINPEKYLA